MLLGTLAWLIGNGALLTWLMCRVAYLDSRERKRMRRIPAQVLEQKFADLVRSVVDDPGLPGLAEPRYGPRVLAEIRTELEVMEEEMGRGKFEEKGVTRESLALCVAMLLDLDRRRYRTPRGSRELSRD